MPGDTVPAVAGQAAGQQGRIKTPVSKSNNLQPKTASPAAERTSHILTLEGKILVYVRQLNGGVSRSIGLPLRLFVGCFRGL